MWLIGYHFIRFDGIPCEHTYAIPKSTRGTPFIYIEGLELSIDGALTIWAPTHIWNGLKILKDNEPHFL